MPLPAQCCRSVQAIVKMVCTSELSFRGAKRRGNLAEPGWITWYSRRKRNCLPEIATSAVGLLAMTNLGALLDRRAYLQICSCHRRSMSAATDAIGAYHFIGSWFASAVPSRDCTPRALPRASRSGRHVGLRPPRNDKPLAFTILSAVCSGRQRCAGPGCPLPYNDFPIIWKGP